MLKLLSISAKELCRILSVDKSALNRFELSIREALEKENTEDELRAMKEHVCLTDSLSEVPITTTGKRRGRM